MTDKTFEKYKLVVDEWFINGFNGRKAYQKIYPKSKDEGAEQRFSKLSSIVKVKDYIKQKQEEAQDHLRTSHSVLLQELENWAYSDITETISLTPEQVKELPKEVRRLITKYKHTTKKVGGDDGVIVENVIELWFVSKEKAMEMIHKHTGFYEIDNKQRKPEVVQVLTVDPLEG